MVHSSDLEKLRSNIMEEISKVDIVSEAPDFSVCTFMQTDIVVKSVIIILILASLYSWNVIFSKILR